VSASPVVGGLRVLDALTLVLNRLNDLVCELRDANRGVAWERRLGDAIVALVRELLGGDNVLIDSHGRVIFPVQVEGERAFVMLYPHGLRGWTYTLVTNKSIVENLKQEFEALGIPLKPLLVMG